MSFSSPRLRREWKTLSIMIDIYCKSNNHEQYKNKNVKSNTLCDDCQDLQDYAYRKLMQCRFQEEKPTCANCPIHCYRKSRAEEIKKVMKYSGPKIMIKHPILAIKHLFDGRKQVELPDS